VGLNFTACGWFLTKSEIRNPKSETNPKSEGQMFKTAPSRAVWDFFRFPPFEFVSGFGFRVSDFQPPPFVSASSIHRAAFSDWFLGCELPNG
jgi:hypothetical protein